MNAPVSSLDGQRLAPDIDYRPDIDGLRAVAVASVIGYHAAPAYVPGGFVGVDVFFVISGFLISKIILSQLGDGTFSIRKFYARRIRRLFPALIVVLSSVWLVGWYLLVSGEFRNLGKHIAGGATYTSNFILLREAGYFDRAAEEKPLLHLWSLAIEEQFYIVWPVLLVICWKRNATMLAIGAIALVSFLVNLKAMKYNVPKGFFHPYYRVWELALGALLAISITRFSSVIAGKGIPWHDRLQWRPRAACNIVSCAGLAMTIAAVFALDDTVIYPGAWALLPALGALCLLAAGPEALINRMLLSRPELVFVGLMSYPLYLWHWPFFSFPAILRHAMTPEYKLFAVVLTSALAWVTYRWVERPIRHRVEARVTLALFAAIGALGLLGHLTQVAAAKPRLADPRIDDIVAARADWAFPSDLKLETMLSKVGVFTKGTGDNKVLFFGDSNMQQYWPRINRLMSTEARSGVAVIFATAGGCPPIPRVRHRGAPHCDGFAENVIDHARDPAIRTVVINAAWYEYFLRSKYFFDDEKKEELSIGNSASNAAFAELAKMIGRLRGWGKRVVVVLNMPTGGALDPEAMIKRSIWGDVEIVSQPLDRAAFERVWAPVGRKLAEVAQSSGAEVIDPISALCGPVTCPSVTDDGMPIYKDAGHLRASYVRDHVFFLDDVLSR